VFCFFKKQAQKQEGFYDHPVIGVKKASLE
jgi:hypothetical protein